MTESTGRYWIERDPADMTGELASVLSEHGYRLTTQTANTAHFERRPPSALNWLWIFVPLIGWAILIMTLLGSHGQQAMVAFNYGESEGRSWMAVRSSQSELLDLFSKLEPA